MRRRDLLALIATIIAIPHCARAQQSHRLRRVGMILTFAEDDPETPLRKAVYRETLADAGWIEGSNLELRFGWTGGDAAKASSLARELVAWSPEVIVTSALHVFQAVHNETKIVPIVFINIADPLSSGVVKSLAHPEGNVTGFANMTLVLPSMWLDLLKQIAPETERVSVLYNPKTISNLRLVQEAFETSAPAIGVRLTTWHVFDDADIQRAIRETAATRRSALVVVPDGFTAMRRSIIVPLVAEYNLPAMYGFGFYPRGGGLMSYGIDALEINRSAARYVDRILRGAKPSELPVQQPTKFELVVNLRTARSLGLEVPPALLIAATEIIE
jgi:putative tryptophan/tyrosine transport system substrate-binding protein